MVQNSETMTEYILTGTWGPDKSIHGKWVDPFTNFEFDFEYEASPSGKDRYTGVFSTARSTIVETAVIRRNNRGDWIEGFGENRFGKFTLEGKLMDPSSCCYCITKTYTWMGSMKMQREGNHYIRFSFDMDAEMGEGLSLSKMSSPKTSSLEMFQNLIRQTSENKSPRASGGMGHFSTGNILSSSSVHI